MGIKMRIIVLLLVFIMSMSYVIAQQCDYKVEILADAGEFEQEDFRWRMRATKIEGIPANITGTAEITSDSRSIKKYKPWTNAAISKQKTSNEYSPNLKPGKYEISAEINVNCDDINKDNNKDERKIEIKGEIGETKAKDSKSKNDEEKAINKEDSIKNKPETNTKNTQTTKTINKELNNEAAENTIELKSKNARQKPVLQPTANSIKQPQIVYESSNEKAKNLMLIFLLALSVLLNIVLIWRR